MNALARLTKAEKLLAEATVEDLPDVASLVDYAEAARVYAQRAQLGTRAINHATKIKLLAERTLVDLVDRGQDEGQIAIRGGDQKTKGPKSGARTLVDLGVDKRRLSEGRQIRDTFSAEEIEDVVEAANAADKEVSRGEVLRAARKPLIDLGDRTPEDFRAATAARVALRVISKAAVEVDAAAAVRGERADLRTEMKRQALTAITWLQSLAKECDR